MKFKNDIEAQAGFKDAGGDLGVAGQLLSSTGTGTEWVSLSEISGVDGTGTANYVAKWSDTDTITNSVIYDNGTNVGIGTAFPGARLEVKSAAPDTFFADFISSTGSGSAKIYENSNSHPLLYMADADGTTTVVLNSSGVSYLTSGNIIIGGTADNGDLLQVQGTGYFSGNVGIGTVNPSSKLDISGAVKIDTDGTYGSEYGMVGFGGTTDGYNRIFGRTTTADGLFLASATGRGIFFRANGGNTDHMVVIASGNVGIGTTSPDTLLQATNTADGTNYISYEIGNSAVNASNKGGFAIYELGTKQATLEYYRDGSGKFEIASQGASNHISLATTAVGGTTPTERIRITSAGGISFGSTGTAYGTSGQILKSNANASPTWVDASTVIGGPYLPLDGGLMTGAGNITMPDNFELRAGTDSDLRIYNNGTNSFILNTVGNLNIRNTADDGNITFQSDDGSGGYTSYFLINGDSEQTQVYKDFRFQDDVKAKFGNTEDLQIYHDGSNSFIQDAGTGFLVIDTNGTDVRITKTDNEFMAKFVTDAQVELYYNGSKKFETTSTGVTVTGAATATTFLGDLNGTINTVTTAVTKANSTNDTTVATTAFVKNLIGTIPAGLVFQGTWNADTNTPTLTSGTGTTGNFYIVSVDGSTNLDGITDWKVGDWAVFVEQGASDQWEKVDNSSVLDGSGTGQTVALWSGSGTSNTLTDAPITVSGNNATFAGNVLLSGYLSVTSNNIGTGATRWIGADGTTSTWFYNVPTGGNHYFAVNNTNQLSINENNAFFTGDVGIGTTDPNQQLEILYPSYIDKDTVEGLIRLTGQSNTENAGDTPSAGVGIEFYNKWTGGAPYSIGRISARASQSYDGGLQFDVAQNSAPGQSNFTTAMTILDNGNVGIGTTSPQSILDIRETNRVFDGYGNINVFTTNAFAANLGGSIALGGTSNTSGGTSPYPFAKIQGIKEGTGNWSGALLFGTTNSDSSISEKMRISANGNVTIKGTGTKLQWERASDNAAGIVYLTKTEDLGSNGSAKLHGYDGITFTTAGTETERMRITSAGGISFGSTGTAYGTSGQILKSNANASPTWVDASTVIGGPYVTIGTAQTITAAKTFTADVNVGAASTDGAGIHLIYSTTVPEIRIQAGENGASAFSIYNTATSPDAEQFFINNNLGSSHLGNARGALKLETSAGVNLTLSGSDATFAGLIDAGGRLKVSGGATDQYYFEGARTGVGVTYRLYDNANNIYHDSWSSQVFRLNQNGGSGGNLIVTGGNVGIGTADPDVSLAIKTGSSAGIAKISSDANGAMYSANGDVQLFTNNSAYSINFFSANKAGNLMRILDNGNVGIGTTNPSAKLNISGTGTGAAIDWTNTTATTGRSYRWVSLNAGGFAIEDLTASGATRMVINSSGNVGIGTPSPGCKLDLYDPTVSGTSLKIRNISAQLQIESTSAGDASIYFLPNATGSQSAAFKVTDGYNFAFRNATGAEYLRIKTASGNVGINTTNPTEKLAVTGNIETTETANGVKIGFNVGDSFTLNGADTAHYGLSCGSSTSVPLVLSGYYGVAIATNGLERVRILQSNGYVGILQTVPSYALDVTGTIRATGNVIAFSDARAKENIKTIDSALEKVNKLRGVEFNKIGEEKTCIGVIAQEVEEVLPEVVETDDNGMKAVAYGNMVGLLIEAMKEQQKQIDELKAKLESYGS
jgi:hypothetical protein